MTEIFAQARHEFNLDSIMWGLTVDGELASTGTIGSHDNIDTRYRIASMTKSFTAAAVLGLRDEGLLSLDVPVLEYAPELSGVVNPNHGPPLTLRHLLSMSSGLATDDPWADRHLDASSAEMDVHYGRDFEFACATGTNFEYSNLGFALIGRVVERVTGRRVRDHVTERFLEPLSMTATTWDPPSAHLWAPPTRVEDGRIIADGLAPIGDGEIAPMGGLWSTVADLARWSMWLDAANYFSNDFSNDRPNDSGPDQYDSNTSLLSVASRREMQTIQTYAGNVALDGVKAPFGYGFGLTLRDDPDLGMVVSHSGGLPGYGSNMRWLPGRRIGVVAVSNTTYAPMALCTQRVLLMLHSAGLIAPSRIPVSALLKHRAQELTALLNDWSDDGAHLILADNVELDESFERRRDAAQRLLQACGTIEINSIEARSRTEGTINVRGPSGQATIEIMLAPIFGAPIQWYETKIA